MNIQWHTEKRKTASLKDYAKNPRQFTEKGMADLKKSLERLGYIDPIAINLDGTIIGGHARKQTLLALGLHEVDVRVPSRQLTPKEVDEAIIRLNKNSAGIWDFKILEEHFEQSELIEWGFEKSEFNAFATRDKVNPDETPELSSAAVTARGDMWRLGNHIIRCGDSTNHEDLALLLTGNNPDMVFTDPPYGINEKGDRSKRGGITAGNKLHDFIDNSTKYAIEAFKLIQSLPVSIPVQVWWGANYYAESLPPSANWLVWDKRVEDKQRDTQNDCELAWAMSKYKSVRIFRHLWKGLIKDSEHGERRVHPTQKPVALAEWAFAELGKAEMKVLDLFLGSGSTLIACEKAAHTCYGMELSPQYCDVIIRRWQNFTGKKAVHAVSGRPFDEHREVKVS